MNFNFDRLIEQSNKNVVDNFKDNLTEDIKTIIIEKVKEDGIYSEPLQTSEGYINQNLYELNFTIIIFELVTENTIEVYARDNAFLTLDM